LDNESGSGGSNGGGANDGSSVDDGSDGGGSDKETTNRDPSNQGTDLTGDASENPPIDSAHIVPSDSILNGSPPSVGGQLGSATTVVPEVAATLSGAMLDLGGTTVVASVMGIEVVVGSRTLSAGDPAQTVQDGHVVSVGKSGLIIDGSSTQPFSALSTPPPSAQSTIIFSVIDNTYTAVLENARITLGSTMLSVGDQAVTMLDGHVISAVYGGLVVDGTSTVSLDVPYASGAVFTMNGQTYSAYEDGGNLVLGSDTLSIGGPAITFDGHVFSAAPSGLVMDGTTMIPTSACSTDNVVQGLEAVFTAGGHTFTAERVPQYSNVIEIGSQSLTVGGPAQTIGGGLMSAGTSGIVVNGTSTAAYSTMRAEAVITANGRVMTAFEAAGRSDVYIVDGMTLTVGGPAVSIDGIAVSAVTRGVVVDGSITASMSTVPAETSAATSGSTELFTGASDRLRAVSVGFSLLVTFIALLVTL